MNRSGLGSRALNVELQKQLNKNETNQANSVSKFGSTYAAGDKVIQVINNYDKEVFNGDIGTIYSIDKEEGILLIDFDGRQVKYEINELDELALAYAVSIHKSQGSEYKAVVIPISTAHYLMLERNLLYTAITRGKKLVVLIGQKKALAIAIKNKRSLNRVTSLKHWLQQRKISL
jgi:exodeoxyribonuclease V alpha subunit